ncbi:MAG: amino acid transporter permease [Frankiales bacterium]|nr:amino acid transporter permease [Frankiales bacterium]
MLQQLLNAMVLGSVFLLFSLGLSLAWGTLDVLNLAHGAVFVFGAYAAYETSLHTSSPVLVVLVAMAGCGLVAAALEVCAFGRIRTRSGSKRQAEFGVLVSSLGGATVIGHLIDQRTDGQMFSQTAVTPTIYDVAGVRFSSVDVVIVVVSAVVAAVLHSGITRWRNGRAVRAVAVDPLTAGLMGINVAWLAICTMFVSGALAGLAGALLAFNSSGMTVGTGEAYMVSAFAILVVGGVGSVPGAAIVSYGLAVAQTAVVAYGPSEFQTGVAFLLILVFLVYRPSGLFSKQLAVRV